jgi:hypothetical protein
MKKSMLVIMVLGGLGICLYVIFWNKSEAESAITHFHEQFNNGQFDKIWNEAQPKFHDTFTNIKFMNYLQDVQKKLGKAKSSEQVSKREINRFSWTRKIEIVQKTVFEKGESIETFSFEFINNKPLLIGYEIK